MTGCLTYLGLLALGFALSAFIYYEPEATKVVIVGVIVLAAFGGFLVDRNRRY